MYYLIISITLLLNTYFGQKLRKKFNNLRFLETGYILNLFLSLYIISPSIIFITSSFTEGDPISYILNGFTYSDDKLITAHLFRMLFYQFIFIISYLKYRGSNVITFNIQNFNFKKPLALFFFTILLVSYFFLFAFSGSFDGYLESYQRYDHLNRPLRLFVSTIVRFKSAFIIFFIIYFFTYFRKNRYVQFIGFLCLILIEGIYSAGARISVFFILLQCFSIILILNGLPKFRSLVIGSFICLSGFVLVEKSRNNSETNLSSNEIIELLPGELGAVFFTSYHLYQKRHDDQLPQKNIKMLFFDFIAPFVPNAELVNIDPIFWYRDNYFPKSEIPPFTLGPIANTAIWEGEIGLFVRAWLSALFFAKFSNFVTKNDTTPLTLFVYLAIFSTTVMILKYSIFFHFTLFVKNFLLPLILFKMIKEIFNFYRKKPIHL